MVVTNAPVTLCVYPDREHAEQLVALLREQTRSTLWVHISAASVAERSGSTKPEPSEKPIVTQESGCPQPGDASGPM